jgi:hypothetical protein
MYLTIHHIKSNNLIKPVFDYIVNGTCSTVSIRPCDIPDLSLRNTVERVSHYLYCILPNHSQIPFTSMLIIMDFYYQTVQLGITISTHHEDLLSIVHRL